MQCILLSVYVFRMVGFPKQWYSRRSRSESHTSSSSLDMDPFDSLPPTTSPSPSPFSYLADTTSAITAHFLTTTPTSITAASTHQVSPATRPGHGLFLTGPTHNHAHPQFLNTLSAPALPPSAAFPLSPPRPPPLHDSGLVASMPPMVTEEEGVLLVAQEVEVLCDNMQEFHLGEMEEEVEEEEEEEKAAASRGKEEGEIENTGNGDDGLSVDGKLLLKVLIILCFLCFLCNVLFSRLRLNGCFWSLTNFFGVLLGYAFFKYVHENEHFVMETGLFNSSINASIRHHSPFTIIITVSSFSFFLFNAHHSCSLVIDHTFSYFDAEQPSSLPSHSSFFFIWISIYYCDWSNSGTSHCELSFCHRCLYFCYSAE